MTHDELMKQINGYDKQIVIIKEAMRMDPDNGEHYEFLLDTIKKAQYEAIEFYKDILEEQ